MWQEEIREVRSLGAAAPRNWRRVKPLKKEEMATGGAMDWVLKHPVRPSKRKFAWAEVGNKCKHLTWAWLAVITTFVPPVLHASFSTASSLFSCFIISASFSYFLVRHAAPPGRGLRITLFFGFSYVISGGRIFLGILSFKGHEMPLPFTAGWQTTNVNPLVIEKSESGAPCPLKCSSERLSEMHQRVQQPEKSRKILRILDGVNALRRICCLRCDLGCLEPGPVRERIVICNDYYGVPRAFGSGAHGAAASLHSFPKDLAFPVDFSQVVSLTASRLDEQDFHNIRSYLESTK
ncbi:hypothetical protein OROHE_000078 [Orobanche hederae]